MSDPCCRTATPTPTHPLMSSTQICPGASPTSGRLQVVSICRYGFWEFLTKGE
jgi:hypothetical protein